MKSFFLLTSIFLLLLACKPEEEKPVFDISGNLKDYKGEIELVENFEAKSQVLIKATEENGNFHLISKDSLEEGLYYLRFSTTQAYLPVFIDNSDLLIEINPEDIRNSGISGTSEQQRKWTNFLQGSKQSENKFLYQKRFVLENSTNYLGLLALNDMLGETPWRMHQTKILFDTIPAVVKQTKLGLQIAHFFDEHQDILAESKQENTSEVAGQIEKILLEEATIDRKNQAVIEQMNVASKEQINNAANVSPPETVNKQKTYAPYFYAYTPDNIEISARDVFNNHKVTLIDFWASWCKPCRAQIPEFRNIYQDYHHKGFEILSISEDKDKVNWTNAIAQDDMNWQHVLDDSKSIAQSYGVHTIPYTLLVDVEGGIIAKDIGPSSLRNLLKQQLD